MRSEMRLTNRQLSLTACQSCHETWWDCQDLAENDLTVLTACQSWMRWDEMKLSGSVITALLLTGFCYRIRLWWNCLANNQSCTVTHWLLVMEWDVISRQISLQHNSLAVGHGMGWDEASTKSVYCHSLPVSHGMRCDETAWKKITESAATHHLLVMWWEVTRQYSKSVHCHSQTVDHGDETAWQKTTSEPSLTCCWSWDEM